MASRPWGCTTGGLPPVSAAIALDTFWALTRNRSIAASMPTTAGKISELELHIAEVVEQTAEIAAEAVLVELLVRLDVPQPAGIRRNLVSHDNAHHVVFPEPSAFHLEVDELDADPQEKPRQEVVDADGERHDVVDFLRRGPAERGDVLLGDHRVVEGVVLVVELDDRPRQLRALGDAEQLGRPHQELGRQARRVAAEEDAQQHRSSRQRALAVTTC
mgnify:CR=1 FL=1